MSLLVAAAVERRLRCSAEASSEQDNPELTNRATLCGVDWPRPVVAVLGQTPAGEEDLYDFGNILKGSHDENFREKTGQ